MADYPMPGNNVFTAEQEKAMRQANRPTTITPTAPLRAKVGDYNNGQQASPNTSSKGDVLLGQGIY